jgi:polyhydroxyalkanoate synthesis regulator phasin
MNVISNSMLLVRRITELKRRRDILIEKQDRLRRTLPEWTFAPLQLVGMSADEIRGMMSDLSDAERDTGIDRLEKEVDHLDQQIEDLENTLLTTPSRSLDSIQAVLDLAVSRFRAQTVSDPNDVFYDYGDARVLFFLERATEDLRALLQEEHRAAG